MQTNIPIPQAELTKVSDLKTDGKNPNRMTKEQHDRLATSIKKYGFIVPIITNKDLLIADGEQRWTVAKSLGMAEVPVIRLPVEEVDRRLLRQVLNKLRGEHELLLDAEEFDAIIADGGKDDLKYLLNLTDKNLATYLKEIHPAENEDYTQPILDKVITDIQRGDIIQLGTNRLMCGDSTHIDDVAKLMDGQIADMVFTDPPYNVDFGQSKNHPSHVYRKIFNDKQTPEQWDIFIEAVSSNLKAFSCGAVYICMASGPEGMRFGWLLSTMGWHWSATLIWLKNSLVLTPADYQRKYEPIFYGWQEGKEHKHPPDRTQTEVWSVNRPSISVEHPTMKPLELITRAITNSSEIGDKILDLFGGSGSTLIACQQTDRNCFMMEIDPRYCEIICQRWEKYTGQKRKLVKNCETPCIQEKSPS